MNGELIPDLFRTEYSRILAVLIRSYGLEHIEIAEDIASDTFMAALETWPYQGVPQNPRAWLYKVAKNKTINKLKQTKVRNETDIENLPDHPETPESWFLDLSEDNINDSRLAMLFVAAHPQIPIESSIAFGLRTLCGFSVDEIASALLSNKETINKRLYRAREKMRELKINADLPPPSELTERLKAVLKMIYLIFNEGYYSENHPELIRPELCHEAMVLGYLLLDQKNTCTHECRSLMALMCFQSSRLTARMSHPDRALLYHEQDRALWNRELIEKGFHYLMLASDKQTLSDYYLEASIAYWHTLEDTNPDKWPSILKLYEVLMIRSPSSVVELNYLNAFSKVHGPLSAITIKLNFDHQNNRYYHVLMSELLSASNPGSAAQHLETAIELSKNEAEKQTLRLKLKSW